MSDSVSVRSAQEEMDRVVKTPFIMLRFGVPIKQMLIDLMTKPEPAEITELKKTHPQLHAVMKRCEVTRKIYARNNNQGQLDDWAAMQEDKSDSLNHQILKELIAAFIIQTPRAPVPPILEPLLAVKHGQPPVSSSTACCADTVNPALWDALARRRISLSRNS
jgi:hypothetical protein